MAGDKVVKHDFKNEYLIPDDVKKDQIKLDRLPNGYSIAYDEEKKCESSGVKEYSSRSMCFSETYGKRKVKDVEMKIEDNKLLVTGQFES